MLRAVGRVQVDDHVRVVVGIGPHQRPRLRRFQLHVVAVQVEVLRVAPRPHAADRTELVRPVVEGHPLVAVGVVDGSDEQDQRRAPLLVRAGHEVTQQHQQRFLAAHLAAVDVRLQPDANPIGRHNRRGPGVGNVAYDDKRQRSVLQRRSEAGGANAVRQRRGALDELHDLVVGGRFPVAGPFRAGQQIRPGIARLPRRALRHRQRHQSRGQTASAKPTKTGSQFALHVR